MHNALGLMVYNDTLTKLAEMCYTNDIKICIHLFIMKELQEWLAEISGSLLDNQFLIYSYFSYFRLLTSSYKFIYIHTIY